MKSAMKAAVMLALGAASVGTYIACRADMRDARARLLAGGRVVSTARGPVEVAEVGDGTAVLVVHGTGGGFDQGMNIARGFMGEWGEGFRSIAVSRFGYLRTPMPQDPSSAAQADALVAVLDTLEVPRAAVIGISAGAHPTAQFALRYPEKVQALIFAVPALYTPPEPGAPPATGPPAIITDYVLRSDFLVWLMGRMAPSVLLRAAGAPPSVQHDLSPQGRKELVDGFFPASTRHAGLIKDIRNAILGWPDLPIEEIKMPVLLIGVEDDPYQSAPVVRYSSGRIPWARAIVLERGGHVMAGQERRVQQEVRTVLLGAHATNKEESSK
jgi:2-hydroxy-6-oxonona-2,4-dienedioate hydrolase